MVASPGEVIVGARRGKGARPRAPRYRGLVVGARLQAMRDAVGAPAGQVHEPMICDPQTVSAQEAITLVLRYLGARSEIWPLPAAVVITRALGEEWPCKPREANRWVPI